MNFTVLEGKTSTDRWYPVYLASSDGNAVAGLTYTGATAYWGTAGGSTKNTYTLSTANWIELGDGYYWLAIGSDEWATQDGYSLEVVGVGAVTWPAYVEVRDRLLSETDSDIVSMAATIASMAATLSSVAMDAAAILDDTGTTGVKLAAAAIGTAQFQDYGIPSLALATSLYTHIADQVMAVVATSQQGPGSVGEILETVRQRLAGYQVINTNNNTLQVYERDAATLRFTLTEAQASGSPTITITPS